MKSLRGRPERYSDDARVFIHATGRSSLQENSDRRAIINLLVARSGSMTLREIDEHFGFSIREKVFALQRSGWVRIEP